jgi:phosphoglucosamine mutase
VTRESRALGRAERADNLREAYERFVSSTFDGGDLAGYTLVVDSAHGAAYKVAPEVMNDLGANVVSIGSSPNGRNINEGCGATAPGLMQLTVRGVHAGRGHRLGRRRRPPHHG